MPILFYIGLPTLIAIAAFASVYAWGRGEAGRASHVLLTFCNAVSCGWSAFFASALLLIVFAPGPGTSRPVQQWAGNEVAMVIFEFRSMLLFVGAGLFLWSLFQAIAACLSTLTKHRRLVACSTLAFCATVAAVTAGFISLGLWMSP